MTDAAQPSESIRRRRHGKQLESAILAAAWDELRSVGYARLTMDSIATRAQTSEPVLYRRWPNKDSLVIAAIEQHRIDNPIDSPDTGALRTDLLAHLTAAGQVLADVFPAVIGAVMSGLRAGSGLSPAQIRDEILDAQDLPLVRTVYQRARDRGELDLKRVPAAVLAMPFDLLRLDMIMNLEAPGVERITSIVDELFLPLLSLYQAA